MEEFGFPFLVGLVGLSIDLSISACFLKKNIPSLLRFAWAFYSRDNC